MDFVKLLGGIALGATGAALYDAFRSSKRTDMGQGVVTGGVGGGGFGGGPGVYSAVAGPTGAGGGGPGLVVGPPAGTDGGATGPRVFNLAVEGDGGELGPIISVEPEIAGPGFGGDSFFGISSSPWFWPLNMNWLFPRPPISMVCRKAETEDDEEILVCEQAYSARPFSQAKPVGYAYAWGPRAGWL